MCVLQYLPREPGPGGTHCAIDTCCGDGNRLQLCWQQGLARDHASQGGLRLLPDKGLRSTAPRARSAGITGDHWDHWGRHWSPRVWLDPDSCTKLSTMGSRTSAQSPLPALLWLPGSLAASSYCNPQSPMRPSKTPATNLS